MNETYLNNYGVNYLWSKIKALINQHSNDIGSYRINGHAISSNPNLTKADIGLSEVGNYQAIPLTDKNNPNGVAPLDGSGKLPVDNLPIMKTINGQPLTGTGNIVFDMNIVEIVTTLPATGKSNKIYLVKDNTSPDSTNQYKEYVWNGTKFEELGTFKTDIDLSAYVRKIDIVSDTQNGIMTKEDKVRLDSIFTGDKPLVSPVLTTIITGFKNNAGQAVAENLVNKTANATGITLEEGYKISIKSTFKWIAREGFKNPTKVDPNGNINTLPPNNTESSPFIGTDITRTTSIYVELQAPMLGLIAKGIKIVPADGIDATRASYVINFTNTRYFGIVSKAPNDITEQDVKNLTSELYAVKGMTKNNITTDNTQYYVYAYPVKYGRLANIIQNGALPVLGAFTEKNIVVNCKSGLNIPYYVYISNNPGAFNNVTLKFE